MARVKLTVNIEIDGESVKGFPYVRAFEPVDRKAFDTTLASNAAFVALPATMTTEQFLFFQALGSVMSFKLMGDGTAVTLNKGGLVIVVDSSNMTGTTVQQNSGGSAKAVGVLAGIT